jgi:organic radical activating enzyme
MADNKIKVVSVEVMNLQDDVLYHNPAIVFYAAGCKWDCKYCHSKNTWNFNQGYYVTPEDYYDIIKDLLFNNAPVTIIGEGGDFYFQLENWFNFVKDIKDKFKLFSDLLKVIWYTGAEVDEIQDIFYNKYPEMQRYFDAVLCGKPFYNKKDKNIKDLYFPSIDVIAKVEITQDGQLIYL